MGLAAAVALMEPKGKAECKKYGDLIVKDRAWLNEELTKLGCVCSPSQANFVFFSTPYLASDVAELYFKKELLSVLAEVGDTINIFVFLLVHMNKMKSS